MATARSDQLQGSFLHGYQIAPIDKQLGSGAYWRKTYDANNRLKMEQTVGGGKTPFTTYLYDANGNLTASVNPASVVNYAYNGFNQLAFTWSGRSGTVYTYNAQGIRTSKVTANTTVSFLLDGGNVAGEMQNGVLISAYLRGINLIRRVIMGGVEYYLFNGHGDVVNLTDESGEVTRYYDYDAFGNEKFPDTTDTNPFRYCGEYFDTETGTYYLRARYYDPEIGRFIQQDTHWSPANAIYGDNPRQIYERQDALGLSTYAYAPEISAIMQSGNLYVYCVNNPVMYSDWTGEAATKGQIHNWVVNDIVNKYEFINMTTNFWIYYPPDNKYNRKYGIADLVSLDTGEVWEVKRVTVSMSSAEEQLKRYYSHTPYDGKYPNLILKKGGSQGTYILPGVIPKDTVDASYLVFYWDCGNGIIQYDYMKFSKKTIAAAVAAGGLAMVVSCTKKPQMVGAPVDVNATCVG